MPSLPDKLLRKLEERKREHAFREFRLAGDLVDFCSNDYLGFSRSPELLRSALRMAYTQTSALNGSGGSRLLRGHSELFEEAEARIARAHGAPAAVIFNSGFDANLGFFESVPQGGDLVLFDEYVHASIRDGIRMSRARSCKFKHNDLQDLERLIGRQERTDSIYVVTESVFSMDGDSPDLTNMAALCEKYACRLVVDEAHGIGVWRTGLVCDRGLEDQVFARVVTFGKALGCHGAAIVGSRVLIQYLTNFARSLIYTTALPPASVAAISAAYDLLLSEQGQEQVEKLQGKIALFRDLVASGPIRSSYALTTSAIQAYLVAGNLAAVSLSQKLAQEGMDIRPVRYPTVPKGAERLRIVLHSFNRDEDIERLVALLHSFPH